MLIDLTQHATRCSDSSGQAQEYLIARHAAVETETVLVQICLELGAPSVICSLKECFQITDCLVYPMQIICFVFLCVQFHTLQIQVASVTVAFYLRFRHKILVDDFLQSLSLYVIYCLHPGKQWCTVCCFGYGHHNLGLIRTTTSFAVMGRSANIAVIQLYNAGKLFDKNAELLIDHAWGWEPTTIEAIKAYRPSSNSLSSGQVLHCPYEPQKAKLVVREMTDLLVLDLVDKGLVTDQMVLTVGYDIENLTDPTRRARYHGAVEKDPYGREIPKQAHGSINLDGHTSSTRKIMCAVSGLFDRIVDENLLVRRMYVVANHVLPEANAPKKNDGAVQLDLFTDYAAEEEKRKAEDAALERERKIQKAALAIKKKYGKNAILKAMNLEEGATAKDRNAQIGGHKA